MDDRKHVTLVGQLLGVLVGAAMYEEKNRTVHEPASTLGNKSFSDSSPLTSIVKWNVEVEVYCVINLF